MRTTAAAALIIVMMIVAFSGCDKVKDAATELGEEALAILIDKAIEAYNARLGDGPEKLTAAGIEAAVNDGRIDVKDLEHVVQCTAGVTQCPVEINIHTEANT